MARKTILMELPPRIVRIVFQDVEVLNIANSNLKKVQQVAVANNVIRYSDPVGS